MGRTKLPRNEAGFVNGVRDIAALNEVLVRQDDVLRELGRQAQGDTPIMPGTQRAMDAAMFEALCCIHERLGNLMVVEAQSH